MQLLDNVRDDLLPHIYAEWDDGVVFNSDNMAAMAPMPDGSDTKGDRDGKNM